MRNTPHRIEVLRAERVGIVDGEPVLEWLVLATVLGWFRFLDAEERTFWLEQKVEASALSLSGSRSRPRIGSDSSMRHMGVKASGRCRRFATRQVI